jgi:formyltetrahydrofolate deformylase
VSLAPQRCQAQTVYNLAPQVTAPGDNHRSDAPQDGSSVYRTARLLISCPDRPGIVAAVSSFLFEHGANIVSSDQHSTDPEGGRFFMRMEFSTAGMDLQRDRLEAAFEQDVADRFEMSWRMSHPGDRKRMAILVSRYEHCVLDLLWRWRRGSLDADVVLVASNHPDLEDDVRSFGVPFHHVPAPTDGKPRAEEALLELLVGEVDLVVLARYMQILSGGFLDRVGVPLINIHHSFLPAFAGPDPHREAYDTGVKIIGATAHYVVEELDAGPIIEQDTARVSHRDSVADLTRLGEDIERTVLARAVALHLADRTLVHANKTIVF